MKKIFITGFQRSGTTLLRRIISMHPSLDDDILHESKRLLQINNIEEANRYMVTGEKVPYYNNLHFIIEYMNKFKRFWPDGIIFNVTREYAPIERSNIRTFKQKPEHIKMFYDENTPEVFGRVVVLGGFPVSYEGIVDYPLVMVERIYKIIGNCPGKDYIKKVCTTKEPWDNGKRLMCGLRYKDRIER